MKKLTFLLIFSFLFANINEAIEAFKHKNYKKSFEMFSKIKSPKAYYYLAKHYYYGYGVKKNINKALKYAQIACNENEPNSCNGAGWIYQHDKKDLDVALSYFLRACKMNLAKACNNAGIIYHNRKDYKNAVKYYKRACDLGYSWGCSNLAWHYYNGKGVEKNIKMIYKYAKKAYEINNKNSLKLGYYYDKYAKDYDKAFKYYKIACDNNDSVACSNISWLVVSKKIKNAKIDNAKFYAKKAIQIDPKNSNAYNDLGIYYNKIYNYKLAYENFKKACDMNNSWGCSNLAWFYKNGKVVKANEIEAFKYYKKACNLDSYNNFKSCDKVEEFITMLIKQNNIDQIKKLLKNNILDINERDISGATLLGKAIELGNNDIATFLVLKGANVNVGYQGQTLLHRAIKSGNLKILKILIKNGANIEAKNFRGMTPLTYAAFIGRPEMLKLLIKHGAKVNVVNNDDLETLFPKGMTPLLYATAQSFPDIVKILLEHGANIYAKNAKGQSAIDYATRQYNYQDGDLENLKLLIQYGLNPNLKLSDGKTILMHVIYSPYKVKFLIKHGADVNRKANDGKTALMIASQYGYDETVKILLKNGAIVNIKDKNGNTALDYAIKNRYDKIVKILKKASQDGL